MAHEQDRHRIAGAKQISDKATELCNKKDMFDVVTEWDPEYNIKHINTSVHHLLLSSHGCLVQIPINDNLITHYDNNDDIRDRVNEKLESLVQALKLIISSTS